MLRVVAATALLVQEARKLTLGQPLVVFVPHTVLSMMEAKGNCWLSPSQMAKYQAILIDQRDIKLFKALTNALNLATLHPAEEAEQIQHGCGSNIEYTYARQANSKDELIYNADLE